MAFITLNKKHFFNNLDIITKQTQSKEKVALVLKDNAYGHGIIEVATMAKEYGITKAVVQNYSEAEVVEDFFEYILVLADFPQKPSTKIRYAINDANVVAKLPKGTLVELKVDTGMHRNGIAMSELSSTLRSIKEQGLVLEAVFTHHRSADELTSEWFWQNEKFTQVKEEATLLARELGFSTLRFHSSNSASLFRFEEFSEDMARVGIAAYGCMKLPHSLNVDGFRAILSLYAKRISSRKLSKGEKVGYGATFKVEEECQVSTYDFGYGDGFLRVCSNSYVTPLGVKMVGRVSMDNSSFVSTKDELLIFDDASVVAPFALTISYEVLTSLKAAIERRVI
jgi:alanine racemase